MMRFDDPIAKRYCQNSRMEVKPKKPFLLCNSINKLVCFLCLATDVKSLPTVVVNSLGSIAAAEMPPDVTASMRWLFASSSSLCFLEDILGNFKRVMLTVTQSMMTDRYDEL